MAYDQNAAYQPPARNYYGNSQQQQAPAQHAYGGGYPAQQQYDHYGQEGYGQDGYDQGYDQTYGYGDYDGYAQQAPQSRAPPHGNGGYQDQQYNAQHANGGQQQYERSYDPRYQQRQPRGGHPPQGQHSDPRGHMQPNQAERQGYSVQPSNQQRQPDPRMANVQHDQRHHRQETYDQQSADLIAPPRSQGHGNSRSPAPPAQRNGNGHRAPQQSRPELPRKTTMEEWKAQEKAKLHAAQMPQTVAQDNAFPTFPTKKDHSRTGTRSSEVQSHSGENSRPATSASHHSREQSSRRPEMSREESSHSQVVHQNGQSQSSLQRPPVEHKPSSFDPVTQRPDGAPQMPSSGGMSNDHQQQQYQQQDRRAQYDQRPAGNPQSPVHSPIYEQQQQSWPVNDRRMSPAKQQIQQPPPQQQQRYDDRSPEPTDFIGRLPHERGQSNQSGVTQRSDPNQYQPAVANANGFALPPRGESISPSYAQQGRKPVPRFDQQKVRSPPQLQPAHSPPPLQQDSQVSSAHSLPPVVAHQTDPMLNTTHRDYMSDQPAYAQRSHNGYLGTSSLNDGRPQTAGSTNDSLGDLYDEYNTVEPMQPANNREDEIEAEMPDFDSAAPSQTSMLHKRNQTVDRHLAEAPAASAPPPMPSMPSQTSINQNMQSQPSQQPRMQPQQPMQQPQDPYRDMAMQKQQHANGHGFDFGTRVTSPPQNQQQQNLAFRPPPQQQSMPQQQQPPQQQQTMQQQGMSYRQGGQPVQPPQPPFANEPSVRRSMDDQRQMPYGHQDHHPAPQRFHPNANPGRGPGPGPGPGFGPRAPGMRPMPPPQRPGADRNYSGHPQAPPTKILERMIDPTQRTESAPPLQQGMQRPPQGRPPPNGAPFSQQRPDQMQQPPVPPPEQKPHPDALPHHPTPVRPGLASNGAPVPAKPPPVRNYNGGPGGPMPTQAPGPQRQASIEQASGPITKPELERLRAVAEGNPNSMKAAFIYAKKLDEASHVLASDGGRADPKTTSRNRQMYANDAAKRIKKLVGAGYPDAQFYLGDSYSQGSMGLAVDSNEAFKYYLAAAKQNHPQGAYRTAMCCEMGPEEGGGTRKDHPKAVQWYRRAAALGDVPAMFKLGMVLSKGLLGQPRQLNEAVTWLKRAAEKADRANPYSLYQLGLLFEPGNPDPEVRNKIIPDEGYARSLFQQAASLGHKSAQFRLGQACEYGQLGLAIDSRASIAYYTKSAAQGHHEAELALSGWYLTGAEGILEHNETEAYLWARKAAASEPPLAKAMFAMGYFTEQGIGCPASLEEAKRWYGRAASQRFPKALERLEELKKNGGKGPRTAQPNKKLGRKDQKKDEAECVVM